MIKSNNNNNKIKLPIISFIVAASDNQVMGQNNQLPWHLPKDFAFFKQQTMHKPIIMGKKTWESIQKILPKRPNIIISRSLDICPEGAYLFSSVEAALDAFKESTEIVIIGGAQIFKAYMHLPARIYFTRVHALIDGDIFMPAIDFSQFKLSFKEDHFKDAKHAFDFTFEIWERI
ncbi:dihydrofolate reductase [Gammaproteobacteria bacterium]|nr:dihydrofolate reductase [Gammaproteobacteria bacterium]